MTTKSALNMSNMVQQMVKWCNIVGVDTAGWCLVKCAVCLTGPLAASSTITDPQSAFTSYIQGKGCGLNTCSYDYYKHYIPVQLNVFPWSVQQMQEPIYNFVFANTLEKKNKIGTENILNTHSGCKM